MTNLYTNIKFNDMKCREAMNFYKDILGGELDIMTVKGSPMESEFPPEKHDLITHSTLKNNGWMLIGADMMQDTATVGDNVGIMLDCQTAEEIETIFAKLSEGGTVFMPLSQQFWGATYGVVTDKFGIEWQLNHTNAA